MACFVLGFSFNSLWKMDRWTDRQTDGSLWMMMSLSMAVELVNALVTPKNGWSSFRGHYLVFISTYCCPMWHWYISSYSRLSTAKARMRSYCCWFFSKLKQLTRWGGLPFIFFCCSWLAGGVLVCISLFLPDVGLTFEVQIKSKIWEIFCSMEYLSENIHVFSMLI